MDTTTVPLVYWVDFVPGFGKFFFTAEIVTPSLYNYPSLCPTIYCLYSMFSLLFFAPFLSSFNFVWPYLRVIFVHLVPVEYSENYNI